mgnify:FL=1|jgi:hypothetical protein
MAEFLTEDNLEDYSVEMVDPVTYINYKGLRIAYGTTTCPGYNVVSVPLKGFSGIITGMASLKNNDEQGYAISISSLNTTGVTFSLGGKDDKTVTFLIIGLSVNNQLWRSL